MTPLLYGLALTIGGMVIGFVLRAWAYPVRPVAYEIAYDAGYNHGYQDAETDHGPAVTLRSAQKGLFQI